MFPNKPNGEVVRKVYTATLLAEWHAHMLANLQNLYRFALLANM